MGDETEVPRLRTRSDLIALGAIVVFIGALAVAYIVFVWTFWHKGH